jgi:hypothetical protein
MSDHLTDLCGTWYEHVDTIPSSMPPTWWMCRFMRKELFNVGSDNLFGEKMTGFGM